MFDRSFMPSLAKEKALNHELENYLHLDLHAKIKAVDDPIQWWQINKLLYPQLHCMALDYLTIPGK